LKHVASVRALVSKVFDCFGGIDEIGVARLYSPQTLGQWHELSLLLGWLAELVRDAFDRCTKRRSTRLWIAPI
jgi:hypothetical protein